MASIYILVSCLAFSAIALDTSGLRNRLKRIFGLKSGQLDVLAPPRVTQDEGWTLIKCDDPASFNEWLGHDEEGMPFRPGEEPSLGSHLLVELYGCDPESLKREDCVGKAMRTRKHGAHAIDLLGSDARLSRETLQ